MAYYFSHSLAIPIMKEELGSSFLGLKTWVPPFFNRRSYFFGTDIYDFIPLKKSWNNATLFHIGKSNVAFLR